MLPNIKLITSSQKEYNLQDLSGNALIIVNTATKCGLAGQFNNLEKLYQKYKSDNVLVLGFPCNQFAEQEKTEDSEMESTCNLNFGVTFPLHKKCDVNGENEHPIYTWLKKEQGGLLSSKIKWNFTKFLVDFNGNVIQRYAPTTKIEKIEKDLITLLKNK